MNLNKMIKCFITLGSVWVSTACSSFVPSVEEKEYVKDAPESVRNAFQVRHPNQKVVFYKILEASDTTYEAEFSDGNKNRSETYLTNGKLVEQEVEVHISEIPEPISKIVLQDLRSRYESVNIYSLQAVEVGSERSYEFKIKTSKSKTGIMEVYYELNGQWKSEAPFQSKPIQNLN